MCNLGDSRVTDMRNGCKETSPERRGLRPLLSIPIPLRSPHSTLLDVSDEGSSFPSLTNSPDTPGGHSPWDTSSDESGTSPPSTPRGAPDAFKLGSGADRSTPHATRSLSSRTLLQPNVLICMGISIAIYLMCSAFALAEREEAQAQSTRSALSTPTQKPIKISSSSRKAHSYDIDTKEGWSPNKSKDKVERQTITTSMVPHRESYTQSKDIVALYEQSNKDLPPQPPIDKIKAVSILTNIILILVVIGWSILAPEDGDRGRGMDPPRWDPAGRTSFRRWVRELMAWVNFTSSRLTPAQQAAAIQLRGLGGVAYEYIIDIPPQCIMFGVNLNGVPTDPVTYILHLLGERYEQNEQERALSDQMLILDFQVRRSDTIDNTLTRWDQARHRAGVVGGAVENFSVLTQLLLRKLGTSNWHIQELLRPTGGLLPRNQQEYNQFIERLKQQYHVIEHFPGNPEYIHGRHHQSHLMHPDATESGQSENAVATYVTDFTDSPMEAPHSYGTSQGYGSMVQMFQADTRSQATTDDPSWWDWDDDSATDTETESSVGETQYDYSEIRGMAPDRAAMVLEEAYALAKGKFRRFMRKPNRRVRRFGERSSAAKGKEKAVVDGKGCSPTGFTTW